MKTLHFCNLVPDKLGAYEALLVAIGGEFGRCGDELVMVLAGEPIPEVARRLRDAGVRWHIVAGWSDGRGGEHPWRFVAPALRLLRAERPDVVTVHFGNELPSLAVRLLSIVAGCGRTHWIWEQDQQIANPSRVTARLSKIRLVGWLFDRMLAVYDGGREAFLRRRVPSSRISVIYNSIADHPGRTPRRWLRGDLELADEDVLLVSTAWLVPRKRIDFLLRAFAELRRATARTARLLLIGEGPERENLEELARDLGIAESIIFLGKRNDVADVLREADMLVHASRAETCTYAITEAMCAGIPAVVTESGAAREQIVDGETGYVTAPDDAEGFAARLRELVDDDGLRRSMGAAARERWRQRYRLEDAARAYHALYRDVARV